jgi:hypothetical protein
MIQPQTSVFDAGGWMIVLGVKSLHNTKPIEKQGQQPIGHTARP